MGQEIVEEESATPNTPNSGDRKLYPKSGGWFDLDSAGTESQFTTGGSIGGSDTQVQYNNGGAFGGIANTTFDDANDILTIGSHLELADSNRETLSADKTLTTTSPTLQNLDPGGANRNLDLPAEADGVIFIIGNRASAAEDITIRDDANTSLTTLNQGDVAYCISDGTGWVILPMQGVVN